jgi:hypothetical protein
VGTPGAPHDDYVDALVQALTYLRGNVGACSFSRAWSCAGRDERSPPPRFAQLQSGLALAGLTPAEAIPLIASLLNLPVPARYLPSPLSPEQQRRRLLATLVEWVLGAARVQPTVIAIEDLHWADLRRWS